MVAIYSLAMQTGKQPIVFGTGEQTRDLIYVEDVVGAFIAAADSEAKGAYNVGTGKETSVLELGALLAPICGTEFEPRMDPARPGEVQRSSLSSDRARDVIGWKATVELEEGLRQTADSFAAEAGARSSS